MNIINIIDINRLCQINMYKILQKYNKQTRVCKINLKGTKNGKVVKEYNFLCKSHIHLQNEEQTKSANNRYIYLNNSGIQVLDIDTYDGLNYIYNLIKTEIYDYNYTDYIYTLEKKIYSGLYINGSLAYKLNKKVFTSIEFDVPIFWKQTISAFLIKTEIVVNF